MKTQPKVSVIVPVYKTAKYLRKCFDSILGQTFKNIELIIVSDGPKEDDLICEEYTQKYSNIRLLKGINKGLGGARNAGISLAKGKYIAFVDSDDWVAPNYIQKMYDAMVSDESIDIVQCGTNIVFEKEINSKLLEDDNNYFAIGQEGKIPVTDDIYGKINVGSWNKLYKKSLLSQYNIKFPENLRNEDAYFTWVYWSVCQNMYCIQDKLYNYLRRDDSLMAKTFKKGMKAEVLDHLIVGELFYKFLKQNDLLEKRKIAFLKAYNISYWFSRDNGDWLRKQHAFFKAHKFLKKIDIPSNFEELKVIKKTSLLGYMRKNYLFSAQKDNKHTIYQILGIKIKIKKKKKTTQQVKNIKEVDEIQEILPERQNLYYNIEGENNKILIIENGIERELKYNEKIEGLVINIQGNNNIIKIYKPFIFSSCFWDITSNDVYVSVESPQITINNLYIKTACGNHQNFILKKPLFISSMKLFLSEENASVEIEEGCMTSMEVVIMPTDAHTVYDIFSNKAVNQIKHGIKIGKNVWIGYSAFIGKNSIVPSNTIIAAHTCLINKTFIEENTVIAGNPASIVKKNICWDILTPTQYMNDSTEK